MPVPKREATIAINESLSTAVAIGGSALVGLIMPAAWTAANITLQGSHDGVTFNNVHTDDGTEKTITAAASRYIALNPADYIGMDEIKLRSGTNAAAVTQAAARTITLVFQSF